MWRRAIRRLSPGRQLLARLNLSEMGSGRSRGQGSFIEKKKNNIDADGIFHGGFP